MTQESKSDCGKMSGDAARTCAEQAYARAGEELRDVVLPQVNMTTFLFSLSSSAMLSLGEMADPDTGHTRMDLPLAKHTIDILAMLEDKTKGNLTPSEERLLKDMLFETRMKFVQKVK